MQEPASKFAMSPYAVAQAVSYAIDQPSEINVGEVILRSIAQP